MMAISTATARVVNKFGDAPVQVVPAPSGLATKVFDARTTAGVEQERKGGGCPEVLFVGRLVERKGVEVLVRAVARLSRHRPIQLTVVGDGEWRSRIVETVAKHGAAEFVRLAGRVSEEELVEAYRRADVFTLPAVVDSKGDTEGLGVVLIEALCAGLPVVGSNVGGIPDIVVDGETGWLVPSGDDERLAEVLADVLDNPREARKRVEVGVRRVQQHFTSEGVAKAYVACYESASVRVGASGTPTKNI